MMRNRKKKLKIAIWVAAVLAIYPLFVLIYTWTMVYRSDLEGGRHGPLDAYRHTLASAVVSYTLDEAAVRLVCFVMESGGKDSNQMDVHNNLVGAHIGGQVTSFSEIEPAVRKHVEEGMVNATEAQRSTWLPQEKWKDERLW